VLAATKDLNLVFIVIALVVEGGVNKLAAHLVSTMNLRDLVIRRFNSIAPAQSALARGRMIDFHCRK